jgi:hypothetical protein
MEKWVTWCHNAAKETQNNVYAWMALMARYWAQPISENPEASRPDLVIPGWCAQYFGDVAQTITFLASGTDFRGPPSFPINGEPAVLEVDEAYKLLGQALGFTSQGRSDFKQFRADTLKKSCSSQE